MKFKKSIIALTLATVSSVSMAETIHTRIHGYVASGPNANSPVAVDFSYSTDMQSVQSGMDGDNFSFASLIDFDQEASIAIHSRHDSDQLQYTFADIDSTDIDGASNFNMYKDRIQNPLFTLEMATNVNVVYSDGVAHSMPFQLFLRGSLPNMAVDSVLRDISTLELENGAQDMGVIEFGGQSITIASIEQCHQTGCGEMSDTAVNVQLNATVIGGSNTVAENEQIAMRLGYDSAWGANYSSSDGSNYSYQLPVDFGFTLSDGTVVQSNSAEPTDINVSTAEDSPNSHWYALTAQMPNVNIISPTGEISTGSVTLRVDGTSEGSKPEGLIDLQSLTNPSLDIRVSTSRGSFDAHGVSIVEYIEPETTSCAIAVNTANLNPQVEVTYMGYDRYIANVSFGSTVGAPSFDSFRVAGLIKNEEGFVFPITDLNPIAQQTLLPGDTVEFVVDFGLIGRGLPKGEYELMVQMLNPTDGTFYSETVKLQD